MTNQEKDQLAAEVGKEIPPAFETDREIPMAVVLDCCFKEMGIYK